MSKPKKSWENGLTAVCWFCDVEFKKSKYCKKCGYYVCPSCGKCGCNLSPDQRAVVDKTFNALKPVFEKCKVCPTTKLLEKIYKLMITQEYILDSTNQKRKRKDREVKRAWGYSIYIKGLIIEHLPYYQPTLMMIQDKYERNKINPTWSKNAKLIFDIAQQAKRGKKAPKE